MRWYVFITLTFSENKMGRVQFLTRTSFFLCVLSRNFIFILDFCLLSPSESLNFVYKSCVDFARPLFVYGEFPTWKTVALGCLVAQSIGWVADFGLGHDLTVHFVGSSSVSGGLCADSSEPGAYFSLSLHPSPTRALSVSQNWIKVKIKKK